MCTAVRFTDANGNLIFGRNLDWTFSYGEKVLITPRGYKMHWAFNEAVPEKDIMPCIGMGVIGEGMPLYFDCANDEGLAIGGLNFPGFAKYADGPIDGKINVPSYEFPYWVACQFKTVDEAEKGLQNVAITATTVGKFQASMLHWIIADKERAIVVEYTESGMNIYHNDLDVLTNQPGFEWHREHVRDYMALTPEVPQDTTWREHTLSAFGSGFGMLGLPGAFNSPSRFVRVAYLNAHYPTQNTEASNISRLFHTLFGVAMIDGGAKVSDGDFERTIYTGGYSQNSKTYYYNTYEDFAIKATSMNDYDLNGTEIITAA